MEINREFTKTAYKIGGGSIGLVIPEGHCDVFGIKDGSEVTLEIKKVNNGEKEG